MLLNKICFIDAMEVVLNYKLQHHPFFKWLVSERFAVRVVEIMDVIAFRPARYCYYPYSIHTQSTGRINMEQVIEVEHQPLTLTTYIYSIWHGLASLAKLRY